MLNSLVVVAFESGQVRCLKVVLVGKSGEQHIKLDLYMKTPRIDVRFSIVTVEPLRRFLVGFQRLLRISQFHLIDLGQMLLLRGRATEVTL